MPQSTKMLIFDDKGVKKMYQLDPQSNHYKQIGEKGQQQSYDETYLQTLTNLKLKFSSETKQIQEQFNDDGIISSYGWNNYDWIMLCIAYCLAQNNNIDDWEQNPDNKVMEMSIETLFQKQTPFWVAFISEQMFQSNPSKENWTTGEFADWVRRYAHNGALALKQRWEKLLVPYQKQPYIARSLFLKELADIAAKNMPKIKENNVPYDKRENNKPIVPNDISGSLKEILEKCKIPAKSVVLSAQGVRYDIYEIEFLGVTDLDKKTNDIAQYLGLPENSVIAGGQVIGKRLTQYLKILRHQNEWHSFGKTEFQAALKQYQGNDELPVCIGLDETGQPVFCDFYDAPHAIIGGTTGSGKSVAMQTFLYSLFKLNAQNLQIAIIDPKGGADYEIFEQEKQLYAHKIFTPDGTNYQEITDVLNQLTDELIERKELFAKNGAKKITEMPITSRPPFIIIVLDELTNLLQNCPNIQNMIAQVAQIGRSLGILLLLATQNPSKKNLGDLLTNIPTRIALHTVSHIESNIILQESGAEKLIGMGDRYVKWNGGEKIFLHGYNI
ncbi:MAG: DNA translocase FtsK [Neisseriaceae bacterium]|nr:DNA translocase FtsK [Neisseriaceae bacterium]